jgi:outer membrane protein assembly factor BamB
MNICERRMLFTIAMVLVLAPTAIGAEPNIRKDWGSGLTKVWEASGLCLGNPKTNGSVSSPAVGNGVAVVLGRDDNKDLVFGFDAETGRKLWSQEVATPAGKEWNNSDAGTGARARPVIDGEHVYTLGAFGQLGCFELKTGVQKWLVNTLGDSKTNVPYWGVCGTPVVYGGNIIVKVGGYAQGAPAPLVMAYEKLTGKLAWKAANATGSWAPLCVVRLDGRDELLAWHSTGLKGLDPLNGAERWNIPWKTAYSCHGTMPAVDGATLFMTSGYGTGCQAFEIKGASPAPLWPVSKAVSSCNSDPVIVGGHVYSFSGNGPSGALKCLELRTGTEKWTSTDFGNGTLVLCDGCLLCLGYSGKLGLVAAEPAEYRKLAVMQLFEAKGAPAYAAPAVANGKAYLRHLGNLACYELTR